MSTFDLRLSRRALLRNLAVGAAAAPFVPWLEAHAQTSAPLRRVLLFYWPNGISAGESTRFWPTGSETDFSVGPNDVLHSLLSRHKANTLVLNGITNRLRPGEYHGHETTAGELWTGHGVVQGRLGGRPEEDGYTRWGGGESVDRLMARELTARNGGQRATPFGAVNLGVDWTVNTQINEAGLTSAMIWDGREQPIQPEADPRAAFRTLFGGGAGADMARRQSIIDFVRGDLRRLEGRVGAADKAKIDAHLSGLRDLERRLSSGSVALPPQCAAPTGTEVAPDTRDIRPSMEAMMDIAVAALSCQRTQVLTFQVGYNTWWNTLHWLESPANGCPHHCLNHDGAEGDNTRGTHLAGVWGMEQFTRLVDKLAAVPEGDGTLLDHTAVVFLTDFADAGSHWTGNLPCVIAGGRAGLRTGRSLRFGTQESQWRAHNDLLLSLVHFLGLDHVTQVGDVGAGPLPLT